jgi:hypothetical protein
MKVGGEKGIAGVRREVGETAIGEMFDCGLGGKFGYSNYFSVEIGCNRHQNS